MLDKQGDYWPPTDEYLSWGCRKFGMKAESIFTDLYREFNTIAVPLQTMEAFYYDVADVARTTSTRKAFRAALRERKAYRYAQLLKIHDRIGTEFTCNFDMLSSSERSASMDLWRESSCDSVVRFLANLVPDEPRTFTRATEDDPKDDPYYKPPHKDYSEFMRDLHQQCEEDRATFAENGFRDPTPLPDSDGEYDEEFDRMNREAAEAGTRAWFSKLKENGGSQAQKPSFQQDIQSPSQPPSTAEASYKATRAVDLSMTPPNDFMDSDDESFSNNSHKDRYSDNPINCHNDGDDTEAKSESQRSSKSFSKTIRPQLKPEGLISPPHVGPDDDHCQPKPQHIMLPHGQYTGSICGFTSESLCQNTPSPECHSDYDEQMEYSDDEFLSDEDDTFSHDSEEDTLSFDVVPRAATTTCGMTSSCDAAPLFESPTINSFTSSKTMSLIYESKSSPLDHSSTPSLVKPTLSSDNGSVDREVDMDDSSLLLDDASLSAINSALHHKHKAQAKSRGAKHRRRMPSSGRYAPAKVCKK